LKHRLAAVTSLLMKDLSHNVDPAPLACVHSSFALVSYKLDESQARYTSNFVASATVDEAHISSNTVITTSCLFASLAMVLTPLSMKV
jgi:hypothetical protein